VTWEEIVNSRWTSGRPLRITSRKKLDAFIKGIFLDLAEEALHGRKSAVPGFGVFYPKRIKARTVVAPGADKPMPVPRSTRVGFRCSKHLKR
jgi:nucleoid DNA-binding protein